MLQDIKPHIFSNTYCCKEAKSLDYILVYENDSIFIKEKNTFLRRRDFSKEENFGDKIHYLFSIDNRNFFMCHKEDLTAQYHFIEQDIQSFRQFQPSWLAFAGITASQLYRWYRNRKYCGRCASPMEHSKSERAVYCPRCNITEYPKISPAVIVGIINGDKILLTKYAGRAQGKYALVAGFMEIGETFEDTVAREVMEEVGVRVKNISYYKSQPWAFSDSLLAGFFAELDGDSKITLDLNELSEGRWVSRADLEQADQGFSLTSEMIETFRLNQHHTKKSMPALDPSIL